MARECWSGGLETRPRGANAWSCAACGILTAMLPCCRAVLLPCCAAESRRGYFFPFVAFPARVCPSPPRGPRARARVRHIPHCAVLHGTVRYILDILGARRRR